MSSQLNVPARPPAPGWVDGGPGLPREYGVTRLVLMARDAGWLHVYWEVSADTWREAERLFGPDVRAGRPVARFIAADGGGFELDVRLEARSWYARVPAGGGLWRAELGLRLADGRFVLLAVSNEVRAPSGAVSDEAEARWATLRTRWEKIYALSGGGRMVESGSLQMMREMGKRWEEATGGRSSWASPKPDRRTAPRLAAV